jgi:peptide deformylase
MAIRKVITNPHPTLRRKARKVVNFDAELHALLEDMVETMRVAPGVGLAAPQVNSSVQVIVVEFGDEEDETIPPKLYEVINPQITQASEETILGMEGCLSVPRLVGEVERSATVTVKGFTRFGQPRKIKAHGWLARIFQHEIDHLNGVLFINKAQALFEVPEGEEESHERLV